jgi:parallel beta-helix repeat protein
VGSKLRSLTAAQLGLAALCTAASVAAAVRPAVPAGADRRPGALALRADLLALMPSRPRAPSAPGAAPEVTGCADDDGPNTLRAAIAAAGDGDTIDLSHLSCSEITLTQGAVPVLLDNLTIVGPGRDRLRIDGAGADRVFIHPGGGALTLRGVTVGHGAVRVSGNKVTGGGCIASAGYAVLDQAEVSDCTAQAEGSYGGGIYAYALRMYTSILSRNVALGNASGGTAAFGGGAYAATIMLVGSTVSANRAAHDSTQGASSYDTGGGIFSNLGGYVGASTIEGNYSNGIGGGVSVFGGELHVVNSTISGNTARGATGGGIDLRVFDGGTISNSTITANHAAGGGGVSLRGQQGTFTLQSSLIAGNDAAVAADVGAVAPLTIAGANNLVVGAGAGVTLPADTLHADPRLLPLADNGGPTRTHALGAGSPALDAGNDSAGLDTDQRGPGFPRRLGAATDIGAFEGFVAQPVAPANVPVTPAALSLLAGFIAAFGLLGICAPAGLRRFFTRLSPRSGHSSHR